MMWMLFFLLFGSLVRPVFAQASLPYTGAVCGVSWTAYRGTARINPTLGFNIHKTAWGNAWDADAISTQSIGVDESGYIRANIGAPNYYADALAFGLADTNSDANLNSLDYAFRISPQQYYAIYENGVEKKSLGQLSGPDASLGTQTLSIAKDSAGTVTYYLQKMADGPLELLYTSTVRATAPRYFFDTSFYTPGSSLNRPLIAVASCRDGSASPTPSASPTASPTPTPTPTPVPTPSTYPNDLVITYDSTGDKDHWKFGDRITFHTSQVPASRIPADSIVRYQGFISVFSGSQGVERFPLLPSGTGSATFLPMTVRHPGADYYFRFRYCFRKRGVVARVCAPFPDIGIPRFLWPSTSAIQSSSLLDRFDLTQEDLREGDGL